MRGASSSGVPVTRQKSIRTRVSATQQPPMGGAATVERSRCAIATCGRVQCGPYVLCDAGTPDGLQAAGSLPQAALLMSPPLRRQTGTRRPGPLSEPLSRRRTSGPHEANANREALPPSRPPRIPRGRPPATRASRRLTRAPRRTGQRPPAGSRAREKQVGIAIVSPARLAGAMQEDPGMSAQILRMPADRDLGADAEQGAGRGRHGWGRRASTVRTESVSAGRDPTFVARRRAPPRGRHNERVVTTGCGVASKARPAEPQTISGPLTERSQASTPRGTPSPRTTRRLLIRCWRLQSKVSMPPGPAAVGWMHSVRRASKGGDRRVRHLSRQGETSPATPRLRRIARKVLLRKPSNWSPPGQ